MKICICLPQAQLYPQPCVVPLFLSHMIYGGTKVSINREFQSIVQCYKASSETIGIQIQAVSFQSLSVSHHILCLARVLAWLGFPQCFNS